MGKHLTNLEIVRTHTHSRIDKTLPTKDLIITHTGLTNS